jgi:hypothetical protein
MQCVLIFEGTRYSMVVSEVGELAQHCEAHRHFQEHCVIVAKTESVN